MNEPDYKTEFMPNNYDSSHPFYAQFSDPERACHNMAKWVWIYSFYTDDPRPTESDYRIAAWDIAHRIPLGSYTTPGGPYGLSHSKDFFARYTDEDGLIYVLTRFMETTDAAEIARQPVLNSLVWLRIPDSWIDSTPEK